MPPANTQNLSANSQTTAKILFPDNPLSALPLVQWLGVRFKPKGHKKIPTKWECRHKNTPSGRIAVCHRQTHKICLLIRRQRQRFCSLIIHCPRYRLYSGWEFDSDPKGIKKSQRSGSVGIKIRPLGESNSPFRIENPTS